MASIGSSMASNDQPQKPYYSYQLFFNKPMDISIQSRHSYTVGSNGRKYPRVSTFVSVTFMERDGSGTFKRNGISLTPEDWYRWMITISELLSKVKTIYVDNRISDSVTENDFKIVNFKGEVLQMVPIMAKLENDYIPAVRIILNEPSIFADFPLIDIKSMHNVLNKIDILTISMCACMLGDTI